LGNFRITAPTRGGRKTPVIDSEAKPYSVFRCTASSNTSDYEPKKHNKRTEGFKVIHLKKRAGGKYYHYGEGIGVRQIT